MPIRIVLTVAAVATMISWGLYATLWNFPNDSASTIQTILAGEYESSCYRCVGPDQNGTIIRPQAEAQFKVVYRGGSPNGQSGGLSLLPNGLGFAVGPYPLAPPNPTLTSFVRNYAVFTVGFFSRVGSGNFSLWFTGPQGNLTSSFYTSKYGGLNLISPGTIFETNILEAPSAGNYTLHYISRNTSANVTGQVVMGPSNATYTRPYFYAGLLTIAVAAALSVVTGFSLRSKSRSAVTATQPQL